MSKAQFLGAEHELRVVGEALDRQIDEAAYPGGLGRAAAVVEKQAVHVCHVVEQQGNQTTGPDVRRRPPSARRFGRSLLRKRP